MSIEYLLKSTDLVELSTELKGRESVAFHMKGLTGKFLSCFVKAEKHDSLMGKKFSFEILGDDILTIVAESQYKRITEEIELIKKRINFLTGGQDE